MHSLFDSLVGFFGPCPRSWAFFLCCCDGYNPLAFYIFCGPLFGSLDLFSVNVCLPGEGVEVGSPTIVSWVLRTIKSPSFFPPCILAFSPHLSVGWFLLPSLPCCSCSLEYTKSLSLLFLLHSGFFELTLCFFWFLLDQPRFRLRLLHHLLIFSVHPHSCALFLFYVHGFFFYSPFFANLFFSCFMCLIPLKKRTSSKSQNVSRYYAHCFTWCFLAILLVCFLYRYIFMFVRIYRIVSSFSGTTTSRGAMSSPRGTNYGT